MINKQNSQNDYEDAQNDMISKFNEGKLKVYRLHLSWMIITAKRRVGDMKNWNWELDIIWDELSSIENENKDKWKNKIQEIDTRVSKAKGDNLALYNVLREKHRLLKEVQEGVGMGGKMVSGDMDDLDE